MGQLGEANTNLLQTKLEIFLSSNPEADIKTGGDESLVVGLWGEEAIEVPLHHEDDELLEALNAVRLPPRFTAIWHEDEKEFEVIFTVLRKGHRFLQRRFEFIYRAIYYYCSFELSSSRLMAIARRARPSGSLWHTNFRNLQPYYRFEELRRERPDADYVKNRTPVSFWIRGINAYDEDLIANLVRNLNFYMSFFDRQTPTILIHEESNRSHTVRDIHRPSFDSFPTTLSGQDIDQHLLILWESAEDGDPFLRFIHYYQILEYAGFYHVKHQIRREVERAIAAPDAISRPDKAAQKVLNAISADRRRDDQKINAMIEDCVDPQEMWEVLEESLASFSKEVELDGGFMLPALVGPSASYEEFVQSWKQFPIYLHRIRNALVHARESRQSTMIAPTTANRARLSPWLLPLSETAARVMLHSRL